MKIKYSAIINTDVNGQIKKLAPIKIELSTI
jgi:hypothetical protein